MRNHRFDPLPRKSISLQLENPYSADVNSNTAKTVTNQKISLITTMCDTIAWSLEKNQVTNRKNDKLGKNDNEISSAFRKIYHIFKNYFCQKHLKEDSIISNDILGVPIAADDRPYRRNGPSTRTSEKKAINPSPHSGFTVLVWMFFLVLLGFAVFEFWQINDIKTTLSKTRAELNTSNEILNKITGEVSAAEETLTTNDSTVRSELKAINSEIRKLWDIANKRNKNNISKNANKTDQLEKQAEKFLAQADDLSSEVAKIKLKTVEIKDLLKKHTEELAASKSQAEASLNVVQTSTSQLDKLETKQKKWMTVIEKLVDEFRVQVNRKLQQIEGSLRKIDKPSEQGL